MAGKHPGVVIEHEQFGDDRGEQVPTTSAGQVGAPHRLLEQRVAGEHQLTASGPACGIRNPKHHRSTGVSRGVIHRDPDCAEIKRVAVAIELDDLARFAEQRSDSKLADPRPEAIDRVGQHEPVRGVNECRAPVGVGHLLRGPDVVDVSMGEQHCGRRQPVLVEDPAQGSHRPLTGVDDDRVRPRTRGQHIAVAGQHAGREPAEQHRNSVPSWPTGGPQPPLTSSAGRLNASIDRVTCGGLPRCPAMKNDARWRNSISSAN